MINLKISRISNDVKNSHKLNKEEILNIEWTPNKHIFSSGVYECLHEGEGYILYFPEAILNNIDFFEYIVGEIGDCFAEYTLTEEQFEFLKMKLL